MYTDINTSNVLHSTKDSNMSVTVIWIRRQILVTPSKSTGSLHFLVLSPTRIQAVILPPLSIIQSKGGGAIPDWLKHNGDGINSEPARRLFSWYKRNICHSKWQRCRILPDTQQDGQIYSVRLLPEYGARRRYDRTYEYSLWILCKYFTIIFSL